jgi:superoxide reductase
MANMQKDLGVPKVGNVYKCDICGNVVTAIDSGVGVLVCCGQDMTLQIAHKKKDEGKEKHVPVIATLGNEVEVKVGSNPHPMEEGHYIVLIQLFKGKKFLAEKRLYPGKPAEAVFVVDDPEDLVAKAYCNVHWLWTT